MSDQVPVKILYTNHRGETAVRRIVPFHPFGESPWSFGETRWHPVAQWLLSAIDVDRDVRRYFAQAGIRAWGDEAVEAALAANSPGRVLEAADTPGNIGPGDVALTIAWPDGSETVEHVSDNAAAVLGYRPAEGDALTA